MRPLVLNLMIMTSPMVLIKLILIKKMIRLESSLKTWEINDYNFSYNFWREIKNIHHLLVMDYNDQGVKKHHGTLRDLMVGSYHTNKNFNPKKDQWHLWHLNDLRELTLLELGSMTQCVEKQYLDGMRPFWAARWIPSSLSH